MAGVYVHIPFCKSFCTYCGFYSVKGKGWEERFEQALLAEIRQKKDFFRNAGVLPDTLYVGGGTPSVLDAARLERLVAAVREGFGLTAGPAPGTAPDAAPDTTSHTTQDAAPDATMDTARDTAPQESPGAGHAESVRPVPGAGHAARLAEFTVEVNPDDVTPEYARALRAMGVTRVSMGMQSFHDRHLQRMNRRHTARQGMEAFRRLREAGIGNISLDLIFGYGGLASGEWEEDLSAVLALGPEHVSAYQMSVEPGSALSAAVRRGEAEILPEKTCRTQYRRLQERLQAAGYEQYEISNFAKGPQWRSRHNSSYWTGSPYAGLGPSAHSYDGRVRGWNGSSIKKYWEYYAGGVRTEGYAGSEVLSAADRFNESVMLGLRRKEGVRLGELDAPLLRRVWPEVVRMVSAGMLQVFRETEDGSAAEPACALPGSAAGAQGYGIKIPSANWFVSDGIIRELFIVE